MSAQVDELSPSYIGARRIGITLARDAVPAAFAPLEIRIDYGGCLPQGAVLPLEMKIQGPSPESFQRRIFRRTAPTVALIRPREGGPHLVTIREVAHNRWWGSLRFTVAGELLAKERPI